MYVVGTRSKKRKGIFPANIYLGSHGKQRGGCKYGRTQRRVNSTLDQVLGGRIPRDNSQDPIVRSVNYSYSSFRVASIDEKKKHSHRKITMTHTQTTNPSHIALRAGKKRGVSCWGWSSGPSVRKISYGTQTKTKNTQM